MTTTMISMIRGERMEGTISGITWKIWAVGASTLALTFSHGKVSVIANGDIPVTAVNDHYMLDWVADYMVYLEGRLVLRITQPRTMEITRGTVTKSMSLIRKQSVEYDDLSLRTINAGNLMFRIPSDKKVSVIDRTNGNVEVRPVKGHYVLNWTDNYTAYIDGNPISINQPRIMEITEM